ncbi:hypothetical protein [Kitasatospora sp. NBC_01266]|uniref:hypothetical protein n=1 Tax=Kitasatospora sp. NBC_01266 TaxID=2903572 RepID=UPI002E2FFD16|nr:hypothetical protein [Kitasatospora sp. NBC_01266]
MAPRELPGPDSGAEQLRLALALALAAAGGALVAAALRGHRARLQLRRAIEVLAEPVPPELRPAPARPAPPDAWWGPGWP